MLGWVSRNWKTIAVAAVATVAFAAVTVATGGLGAPAMLALAAGGFASGAAGYATKQALDGNPVNASDALVAGATSMVITVGTMGVGRLAAPLLTRAAPLVPQVVVRTAAAVPQAARAPAANVAVGATLGAALTPGDRLEGATVGAVNGLLAAPAQRLGQVVAALPLASARRELLGVAHARYQSSIDQADDVARPSAVENYAHVKRLLGAVDENEAVLRRMNVDPDRVRLQLAYSDTHKDYASQDALARRLFPAEYASGEAGQRAARFKALLLHEEPAIDFFRDNARRVGLPPRETERVVDGIRGHNGPATPGSFWGDQWERVIRNHPRVAGSELLGRPYPQPMRESAIPTFLDRHDSRLTMDPRTGQYAGGPVKFLAEGVGRGQTLQASWDSATQVAYDGTTAQLNALRSSFPNLFKTPFIRRGLDELGLTIAVRDRVTFPTPDRAIVTTRNGPVEASDPAALWRALADAPAPPPLPTSTGMAAALPR
jgi:hypothetical protein